MGLAAWHRPNRVWEHPYVNLWKLCRVEHWPRGDSSRQGDVSSRVDRNVGRVIWQIGGNVPAANYIHLPQTRGASLGLTGRFLYLQVLLDPAQHFAIHVDTFTQDGNPCRLSVSDLYDASAAKRSSAGALSVQLAHTAASGAWTLLCIDLAAALAARSHGYRCMKSLQLCATLSVRGAFTSDIVYSLKTLPREMSISQTVVPAEVDLCWLPRQPLLASRSASPERRSLTADSAPLDGAEVFRPFAALLSRPHSSPGLPLLLPAPGPPSSSPGRRSRSASPQRRQPQQPAARPLHPDPALRLERINSCTGKNMHALIWAPSTDEIVYAAGSAIVATTVGERWRHQQPGGVSQRLLLGHGAPISALALGGNGYLLASADAGRPPVVQLWDLPSGTRLGSISGAALGPTTSIQALDVSADGRWLAALARDSRHQLLLLWNVAQLRRSGKARLVAVQTTNGGCRCMRFVPRQNARLITGGVNSIRLWRLKSGRLRGLSVQLQNSGDGGQRLSDNFNDVAFDTSGVVTSSQAQRAYVAASSGSVYQISCAHHTVEAVFQVHQGPVIALAVESGLCVTAGQDRQMRVWRLDFTAHLLEVEHQSPLVALALAGGAARAVACTADGALGVMDLRSESYATLLRTHTSAILDLAVHPTRPEYATIAEGCVKVWAAETHAQLVEFATGGASCACAAWHPGRPHLAVGFADGRLRIFDTAAAVLAGEMRQHRTGVQSVAFDAAGARLYTAGGDGQVCVLDVQQGYLPLAYLATHCGGRGACLAVSADCRLLAAAARTSAKSKAFVAVFDTTTFAPVARLHTGADSLRQISFLPESQVILAATANGRLLKWDLAAGGSTRPQTRQMASCSAFGLDALWGYVAAAGADGQLALWPLDWTEGEEAAPPSALLHGHSGAVSGVAVTPDGRLISVDSQGSVIVWRSRAGSPRHGDSSAQRHTAAHAARHGSPAIAVIHPLALPDRVMPEGRDDGGFQTPAETLFEPSNQQSDGSGERGLRELQPSSLPGGMLCRSPTVDACPLQPAAWSEQRQGGSATHELGSPPRRGSTVSRQLLWSGSTIQRVPPAETRLPPAGDLQPSLDSLIGCSRGPGSALVWRPETGFLAYAAANSVIIDDVSTGRQRLLDHDADQEVTALACSADGTAMASAASSITQKGVSCGAEICLWAAASGTRVASLCRHSGPVHRLAFSPDGRWLASAGGGHGDSSIMLWALPTGEAAAAGALDSPIADIAWLPGPGLPQLLSASQDGVVLWTLEPTHLAMQPLALFPAAASLEPTALTVSSPGSGGATDVFVGTAAGGVWRFSLAERHAGPAERCAIVSAGCAITQLQVAACRLGVSTVSGCVAVLSEAPGRGWVMEHETAVDAAVTTVVFGASMDDAIVATCAGSLWYLNMSEGGRTMLAWGHAAPVASLAVAVDFPSSTGKHETQKAEVIASTAADGVARMWQLGGSGGERAAPLLECRSPEPCTAAIALQGRSGLRCAAGFADGCVRVLDAGSGSVVWTVACHDAAIVGIAVSPDARRLLCISRNGAVTVLEAATGAELMRSEALQRSHTAQPCAYAAPPGEAAVVALAWPDRLQVFAVPWKASECELLATYEVQVDSRSTGALAPACTAFGLQHTAAFATPLRPGQLLLFDWQQRRVTRTINLQNPCTSISTEPPSEEVVTLSLAASPCGRLLAAGTSVGACVVCTHPMAEPDWFSGSVTAAVGFCAGGRRLLAARGNAVEAWDTSAIMERGRLLLPAA